jgi:hypothetical protein
VDLGKKYAVAFIRVKGGAIVGLGRAMTCPRKKK